MTKADPETEHEEERLLRHQAQFERWKMIKKNSSFAGCGYNFLYFKISILKYTYPPAQTRHMTHQTHTDLPPSLSAPLSLKSSIIESPFCSPDRQIDASRERVSVCNLGKDVDKPQHRRGSLTSDRSSPQNSVGAQTDLSPRLPE